MPSPGALIGLFAALLAGGLGLPFLPEDVSLIGGGLLARQGVVRLPHLIAIGLVGVISADWVIYLLGRRYGADLVAHPRMAHRFGAERIETVRGTVERHGMRAVFFARFVLGFRMVTFFAAGTFRVPAAQFALAEAAGSVIFVLATTSLGYLFADRAMRILTDLGHVEHWLLLLGVVGLALYLVLRARAAGELIGSAPPGDGEAAPPPPPPRPGRPS